MVVNKFWVLFTVRKKRKSWNKTREKYMAEEKRKNLAEADKGSYFNQEERLEEFLDDKNEFYISTEAVNAGAL